MMTNLTPIRLQKHLSEQGICSRREAEQMIQNKRIKINGKIALLGDKISPNDIVEIDNEVQKTKKVKTLIIAFNKPKKVESTLKEIKNCKTLANFNFGQTRVFPIGRLDKDSRGLLLLTNDGELSNRLMHPRYKQEKEYLITVDRKIDHSDLKRFENGIDIDGKITHKCKTEQIENKTFRVTLTEGRNRQIRKMCSNLQYKVIDLIRIRQGNIHLGELKAGKHRIINEKELQKLVDTAQSEGL